MTGNMNHDAHETGPNTVTRPRAFGALGGDLGHQAAVHGVVARTRVSG